MASAGRVCAVTVRRQRNFDLRRRSVGRRGGKGDANAKGKEGNGGGNGDRNPQLSQIIVEPGRGAPIAMRERAGKLCGKEATSENRN